MKTKRESIRPADAPKLGTVYRDWRDFTAQVARPWLDNDGEDARVDNWYRLLMMERDLWYLAAALVFADNHIKRLDAEIERLTHGDDER